MRYRRVCCLLIGLALSLSACNEFKWRTAQGARAEFTTFKTFAFAGLADVNKGGIYDNTLMDKRIEFAVVRELTAKGLRQVGVDDPQDLLVQYWVNVQDKQRLESGGTSVGLARGAYGGGGWGAGYGGGVTTYEYKEGTLILDLIEPAKKQLVWRGGGGGARGGSAAENDGVGR